MVCVGGLCVWRGCVCGGRLEGLLVAQPGDPQGFQGFTVFNRAARCDLFAFRTGSQILFTLLVLIKTIRNVRNRCVNFFGFRQ